MQGFEASEEKRRSSMEMSNPRTAQNSERGKKARRTDANESFASTATQGSGRSRRRGADNDDESLAFEIDLNRIESNEKTTLMIKNIPNKYNQNLLLQALERSHKGKFDFFYLPIDFKNKCNVGYAFINFIDTRFIRPFCEEFAGKRWEKFNSEKICEIKYARIQGRDALIQHFKYSSVMNQSDKKLKPIIFPKSELETIELLVQQQKMKSKEERKKD
eukprot:TRINITY_DN4863_c0_g2_i2.p1 TRINITY_DN4863_c0_g2~~TRINITY_DN4863_c0_g2_i2.p1  ORF type:complete len:218 (+),score=54.48 TRINITY_DN4863_c0_g2_i2:187-840(+)